MGRVYRARDIRLDREVALKVLPAEVATDHELLARFRREAKILAALSHPNIATLFGLEELDGTCVLALELVGGETLAEYLKGRRLGLNRALEMCLQIAGALEAAHDRGIIHRDVKPSNVMVSSTGDVKLLDFGIARAMQTGATPPEDVGQPTETRLTQKGTLIGTPAYMSPEQIRGQPLGAGTDVWSFGCLMYEMLAGRRAFGYATVADTFAAILEREPDWKRLPDRTPPPLRSFLIQCLAEERRRRPRDIRRGLLEVETSLGMLGRDRMRWRLPASIAGILAILALAVGATQIWRWQSRAEPQPLAEAPESVADLVIRQLRFLSFESVDGSDAIARELQAAIQVLLADETTLSLTQAEAEDDSAVTAAMERSRPDLGDSARPQAGAGRAEGGQGSTTLGGEVFRDEGRVVVRLWVTESSSNIWQSNWDIPEAQFDVQQMARSALTRLSPLLELAGPDTLIRRPGNARAVRAVVRASQLMLDSAQHDLEETRQAV